ncbi:MAG: trypsin-like serine protease [Verrucomicrobiaceae bacterium]
MTICTIFFLLLLSPLSGIVWRGDVGEVEREQRGEMSQTGKVFYSPLRVFGGSCYALGGKWVLTCRHGTEKWKAGMLKVGFPALGEETFAVKRVVYPEKGDFALLELEKAVKGAKKVSFFTGKAEKGQRAWLGGFGLGGPVGQAKTRGEFHAGHNRVDGLRGGKISISLGKADDATTEKDEATIALFDSGSPLFLEVKGAWQLAGVASTASDGMNPKVGDRGNYAPVAEVVKWIGKITAD